MYESSSEGWGSVHPACPSLLPVPAMNMELFCGWELAYVFCLISRPHSHFKGRSTRGLDFLICLATESTTCMWDHLPARADNPSASKYTSSPLRPPCFIALHYTPSFHEAARSTTGPNWVWSCNSIPNCCDRGGWGAWDVQYRSRKAHATVIGPFCIYKKPQFQCAMETEALSKGLWPLIRNSDPHCELWAPPNADGTKFRH